MKPRIGQAYGPGTIVRVVRATIYGKPAGWHVTVMNLDGRLAAHHVSNN